MTKPEITSDDCKPPAPWKKLDLPDVGEEKLNQIAIDWVDGKIFSDQQVPRPEDLPMVFMPAALGAFDGVHPEELEKIGMVYEYMTNKTMAPRSVNGMPIFWSMRILNVEDTKKLVEKTTALVEARKKADEEALNGI